MQCRAPGVDEPGSEREGSNGSERRDLFFGREDRVIMCVCIRVCVMVIGRLSRDAVPVSMFMVWVWNCLRNCSYW